MLVQFAHALMLRVANATKINNNFLLSVPCAIRSHTVTCKLYIMYSTVGKLFHIWKSLPKKNQEIGCD